MKTVIHLYTTINGCKVNKVAAAGIIGDKASTVELPENRIDRNGSCIDRYIDDRQFTAKGTARRSFRAADFTR